MLLARSARAALRDDQRPRRDGRELLARGEGRARRGRASHGLAGERADLHARHRWLIVKRESLTERPPSRTWSGSTCGWPGGGARARCAWIGDGGASPRCGSPSRLSDAEPGINSPSRRLPAPPATKTWGPASRAGSMQSVPIDVDVVSVDDWMQVLPRLRAGARGPRRLAPRRCVVLDADPTSLPVGSVCGVHLGSALRRGQRGLRGRRKRGQRSPRRSARGAEHDRDPRVRIVLSGYEGRARCAERRGWTRGGWRTKGGYSSAGSDNANQRREANHFPHLRRCAVPGFDAAVRDESSLRPTAPPRRRCTRRTMAWTAALRSPCAATMCGRAVAYPRDTPERAETATRWRAPRDGWRIETDADRLPVCAGGAR